MIGDRIEQDIKHTFHLPASPTKLSKKESKCGPLEWDEFYDSKEMLQDRIPVYSAGSTGHVFFCLHGAGHSA